MVGMNPKSADEVNFSVGQVLRQFVAAKDAVNRSQQSLTTLVLTDPPFGMTPGDDATLKTAMNELDTALDAIDMTWINRIIGIY
jgi:predicted RNA methylase